MASIAFHKFKLSDGDLYYRAATGQAPCASALAALARQSNLPVLITGGSNPEYAQWLFEGQGVDAQKLQLDYAARDTLSNFTTLVDRLRRRGIRHVLLVTSSDHMDRALLVGRVVAGSRGIHLTPVTVPCGDNCRPERRSKVWGDGVRAWGEGGLLRGVGPGTCVLVGP